LSIEQSASRTAVTCSADLVAKPRQVGLRLWG